VNFPGNVREMLDEAADNLGHMLRLSDLISRPVQLSTNGQTLLITSGQLQRGVQLRTTNEGIGFSRLKKAFHTPFGDPADCEL
jgi:hypothetical protein